MYELYVNLKNKSCEIIGKPTELNQIYLWISYSYLMTTGAHPKSRKSLSGRLLTTNDYTVRRSLGRRNIFGIRPTSLRHIRRDMILEQDN